MFLNKWVKEYFIFIVIMNKLILFSWLWAMQLLFFYYMLNREKGEKQTKLTNEVESCPISIKYMLSQNIKKKKRMNQSAFSAHKINVRCVFFLSMVTNMCASSEKIHSRFGSPNVGCECMYVCVCVFVFIIWPLHVSTSCPNLFGFC